MSRKSLKPIEGANRTMRRRLGIKGELLLATAPTVVVLSVLTSLSFALRAGDENNLVLFALAVGITAVLVG